MPYSAPGPFLGAQTASAYQISRSLRFRSSASAYLSRTPASNGDRQKFTWSGWVKRGTLTSGTYYALFAAGGAGANEGLFFDPTAGVYLTNDNGVTAIVTSSVLRDPSAWYHIVCSVDTTQATAANRQIIYFNGVKQTSYTGSYCAPNVNSSSINVSGVQQRIGAHTNAGFYLDGYLAEVNFIDGQAKLPTDFGAFDTNGVWQPAKYTGSYGTNGFYLPFSLSASSTYAGSFNGSSQLLSIPDNAVFTMGSGDFTIEAWVNFAASGRQIVVYQGDAAGSDASISFYLERSSSNYLRLYVASGATGYIASGSTVIPNNQWVHIAGVRNGNNLLCYLNGVQQATTSVTGVSINDSTYPVQISGYGNGAATGLIVNGSISNVRIVKGTAVYTSNFTPPSQALTAISGTSLLCLQSSSPTQENSGNSLTITNVGTVTTSTATPFVANVTADASGNNNGWIPANINASSSGPTYDSMIDSPTNYADGGNGRGNYCVLNPLSNDSTNTLSAGNLNYSIAANQNGYPTSTFQFSSGKWYWECTVSSTHNSIGIVLASTNTTTGTFSTGYGYYSNGSTSSKYVNGTSSAYGVAFTTNSVIGVAVDLDSGTPTITFYKDGASQGAITIAAGLYKVGGGNGNSVAAASGSYNFGQIAFAQTVPSGFSALNTQNLPTPTIAAGNKYFDATTYTGNGTSQSITNNGSFQPDLVWIKPRVAAGTSHVLTDAVRGVSKFLSSNGTSAESSVPGFQLTAFNSNGFTLVDNANGDYGVNGASGGTYSGTPPNFIAWQWNAGGSTVSNTSGSITSQVRANPTAGFSVVTYTGTGANATVGHGLGVAPSMVIVKSRSQSAQSWAVWHTSFGAASNTDYLLLDSTTNKGGFGSVAFWNNTVPNSTTFSLGTYAGINNSTSTYVAYCFAPVAGYSAAFSYTGNGSADGPMVYLGFRPRFVLIKCSSTAPNDWVIYDTTRNTYNATINRLFPDLSDAESTGAGGDIDVLSNGLKIRSTYGNVNASGGSYIGYAIAENPFKVSRAR